MKFNVLNPMDDYVGFFLDIKDPYYGKIARIKHHDFAYSGDYDVIFADKIERKIEEKKLELFYRGNDLRKIRLYSKKRRSLNFLPIWSTISGIEIDILELDYFSLFGESLCEYNPENRLILSRRQVIQA